jgi:hypothetical protein
LKEKDLIGKSVDGLKLSDRWALTGRWIAVELYSPERLPLRLIQAVGADARSCIEQLKQRGLDPSLFEYQPLDPPYKT